MVKDPPRLLEAARDCTHVVVPSTVVLPPGVLEGLSLTAAKCTVLTERFMIDVITQAIRHPAGKVAKESSKTTNRSKTGAKMSAQERPNKRARKNRAKSNGKRPEKESETAEASRG